MIVPPPPPPMQMSMPQPPSLPGGITVHGNGTATIIADQASITIRLFSRNNAQTITDAALAPVVDELVRLGIDRTDITTPVYLTGGSATTNANIVAVVHHPTAAMIQNGMTTLAGQFTATSPILLSGAQVQLTANDCAATRAQAQSAAIHQARASAESIAHDLGVHVGQVLAVEYQANVFDTSGDCVYSYGLGPYMSGQFNTPDDYLKVRVSSSVTIRYAIK